MGATCACYLAIMVLFGRQILQLYVGQPALDVNYIQLNSIAAGRTVEESFFSASADAITPRRPGHRDYPVDGRGVVFSGATREPIVASGNRDPGHASTK